MGFWAKLFGRTKVKLPEDPGCWEYKNKLLIINKTRARELHSPGGAIRFEKGPLPYRVLVVHHSDFNVYSYENKCAGCGNRLDPDDSGKGVVKCTFLGGATYDASGKMLDTDKDMSIRTLPVDIEGDVITIRIK